MSDETTKKWEQPNRYVPRTNREGTVYLGFEDDKTSVAPSGDYYLRGGICWPLYVPSDLALRGHALIVGHHVDSDRRYVLEERTFVTMDHVIEPEPGRGHVVKFEGLGAWFNRIWGLYAVDRYYVFQEEQVCRRWLLSAIRSNLVMPKPHILKTKWDNDETAMLLVRELNAMDKIFYRKRESMPLGVFADLENHNADPDGVYPALHALKCALYGMEAAPCRAIREKQEAAKL
jgi:hypothetical protein